MITPRTLLATVVTLVAFASNSILCRMALVDGDIDPASFTGIRLLSGVLMLLVVVQLRDGAQIRGAGSWWSAAALFLYAIAFSYAYLSLDAGVGALILFGAVQLTMIGTALVSGERPHFREWVGLAAAVAGLVYLVSPGLSAPSLEGSALMAGAGVAWGVYSLRGRGAARPVVETAGNFLRTVPAVLVLVLVTWGSVSLSVEGVVLAVLSGALASGMGYVIWYVALKGLASTQAATVQLAVPVIAGLGGVLLLNENLTLRLMLCGVMILGGIALALSTRRVS